MDHIWCALTGSVKAVKVEGLSLWITWNFKTSETNKDVGELQHLKLLPLCITTKQAFTETETQSQLSGCACERWDSTCSRRRLNRSAVTQSCGHWTPVNTNNSLIGFSRLHMPGHVPHVEPKGYEEFEDWDGAPLACYHQMAVELLTRIFIRFQHLSAPANSL